MKKLLAVFMATLLAVSPVLALQLNQVASWYGKVGEVDFNDADISRISLSGNAWRQVDSETEEILKEGGLVGLYFSGTSEDDERLTVGLVVRGVACEDFEEDLLICSGSGRLIIREGLTTTRETVDVTFGIFDGDLAIVLFGDDIAIVELSRYNFS